MAKLKTYQPPALAVAHTCNEGRQHRGADSPGQMKPRNRIAMAAGVAAAAFGPARHRKKAQKHMNYLPAKWIFLPDRSRNVSATPFWRQAFALAELLLEGTLGLTSGEYLL